jgi:hypothetical protein
VAVEAQKSLEASTAVDFVCRNEFDFTIKEIADGKPLAEVEGISYRARPVRSSTIRIVRSWAIWTTFRSSRRSTSAT